MFFHGDSPAAGLLIVEDVAEGAEQGITTLVGGTRGGAWRRPRAPGGIAWEGHDGSPPNPIFDGDRLLFLPPGERR